MAAANERLIMKESRPTITAAPIPVSVDALSPLNLSLLVLLLAGLGAVTVRRLS